MAATESSSKTPQELVADFWDKFISKKPSKVTSIFPSSLYATLLPAPQARGPAEVHNAADSYEKAVAECKTKVSRIIRDCHRSNEKFTDPDFDIKGSAFDCLLSLNWRPPRPSTDPAEVVQALDTLQGARVLGSDDSIPLLVQNLRKILTSKGGDDDDDDSGDDFNPEPQSVHRVGWIFEEPQFTVSGFDSSDIKQGGASQDCWWLSAVATICHREDLMQRVCVAKDEECGVYGFVFHRDGEWVPVVVDDYLFLRSPDFADTRMGAYDPTDSAGKKYRKANQTGSEVLYFASCADKNETWLPLMEKAYAKLHGDYNAIWGGYIGEAVEDLTGGVATEFCMEDILDKKRLWVELLNADNEFVFGVDLLADPTIVTNGLAPSHAYSLLGARQEVGEDGTEIKLVKIRNPWGSRADASVGEWTGPWSDGSKEWTPYWLTKLDYKFGDDGVFWMTFQDMLSTFTNLYRTRIFDKSWSVVQKWTRVNVAWLTGYLQRKFVIEVKAPGVVVVVLSQLDTRYFRGLEGQYSFLLHFILQKKDGEPGDYICRVRPRREDFFRANRSVSCEVELEAGTYEVIPKLTAQRNTQRGTIEDAIKHYAESKPQKLRQVGVSYDVAHAKAAETEEVPAHAAKESEKATAETTEKPAAEATEKPEKAPEDTEKPPQPTAEEDAETQNDALDFVPQVAPGAAPEDHKDEGQQTDDHEPEGAPGSGGDSDEAAATSPWNAICVIGLSVYVKDAEVDITLAEPKDPEEAACLAVDEKTQAGATM